MKKQKLIGESGFDTYYNEFFGQRWAKLKKALLDNSKQIKYTENLLKPYYLDYASIKAASALPTLNEGVCLDMCAAPGGKTLVLSNIMGKNVNIVANELSANRRNRLINVLDEHLSPQKREKISVTGYDASLMPKYERNKYERILLDAPCSSERHVLQSSKHLAQWSQSRIKNLAQRQWSLLSAAFLLLKPEGFLLYSTCALSKFENDDTVAKLFKKYKDDVSIFKEYENEGAEKTEYGHIFLPDNSAGAGPIYFSVIMKK